MITHEGVASAGRAHEPAGADRRRPGSSGGMMPTGAEVTVYPQFNALYYSYYLQGLSDLHGMGGLKLSRAGFPDFGHDCLAFRVRTAEGERKVYIHAHDSPTLPPEALEWADVFGKVNLDPSIVPDGHQDQVVPIGPAFPVRLWGPMRAAYLGLRNLVSSRHNLGSYQRIDYDLRDKPGNRSRGECYKLHLIHYAKLFTHGRLPLSGYGPGPSRGDYIFFSSGLWPERHTVSDWAEANREANQNRVIFIEACGDLPGVEFEGGFWARKRVPVENYEHLTSPVNYSHREYIEKTRASAVVFNTPAFKRCHSWKLGEFLSLGKAIVTLPLAREMPAPLVHGEHAHFVDGSHASVREAVVRICQDHDYRRHLETNARAYYERWLEPSAVIGRLGDR